MRSKMFVLAVVFLVLVFGSTAAYAVQPGDHENRDWNAGELDKDSDPSGGMGSDEGLRVIDYNVDRRKKPGKKMLKKKKAWQYIGDLRERLTSGNYTGEILLRSAPDPKHHTISDGIIFNKGGGRNYYVKREDGHHIIMLDIAGGRKEKIVTEENFPKFENAINDDNNRPYILFDEDGNEAAIVFLEWHTNIKQKFNKTGEVVIILEGARPGRRHGRMFQ